MLKIKDDVDLKELEKFGFLFKYDIDTGQPKEMYKVERLYGLHFKRKNKRKIIGIFNKNWHLNRELDCFKWIIDENILWAYSKFKAYDFDFDTLYDLIKADLVEKVEE